MKIIALLLLLSSTCFARWAKVDDFPYIIEDFSQHFKVKKNGDSTLLVTKTFKIRTLESRPFFKNFKLSNNKNLGTLKIIEARVTNGKTVVPVSLDQIKVNEHGEMQEFIIPYPFLAIDTLVFLKFEKETKATVPRHFSRMIKIAPEHLVKKFNCLIESEVPLNLTVNDRSSLLDVKSWKESDKSVLSIVLKKPYTEFLVDQEIVPSLSQQTFFKVTSDPDWVKIHDHFKLQYDQILAEALPESLNKFALGLKKEPDHEVIVKQLLSFIKKNFTQLKGKVIEVDRFIPQKISQTLRTKKGWPIDLSVMLVSLLKKAGLDADLALVLTSTPDRLRDQSLDFPNSNFNHAVVKITSGNSIFWINPSDISFSRLSHRSIITNKVALVLDGRRKAEKIQDNLPIDNFYSVSQISTFAPNSEIKVQADLKFKKNAIFALTDIEGPKAREEVEEKLKLTLAMGNNHKEITIYSFDLSERNFNELNFSASYSTDKLGEGTLQAFKPYGFKVRYPLSKFLMKYPDWQGDLYIGDTQVVSKTHFLKDMFVSENPMDCSVTSPWLDYENKIVMEPNGTKIIETVTVKKSFLSHSQYSSKNFINFQNEINHCLKGPFVVLSFGGNHRAGVAKLNETFQQMPLLERAEMRFSLAKKILEGDADPGLNKANAMDFLMTNVEEAPSHGSSFRMLAEQILKIHSEERDTISEAKELLTRGLKYNPSHQGLYLVYLYTLSLLKKDDEVKKSLTHVFKLSPVNNPSDLMLFGDLYASVGDHLRSLNCYLKAVDISKTPNDKLNSLISVGKSYLNQKNPVKCIEISKQVLEKDSVHSEAQKLITECLAQNRQFEESVEIARDAHKKLPSEKLSENLAESLVNRGNHHLNLRHVDLAEADFKESIHYSQTSEAYFGMAKIAYNNRGTFDFAYTLVMKGKKQLKGETVEQYLKKCLDIFKNDSENSIKLNQELLQIASTVPEKVMLLSEIARHQKELNMGKESEKTVQTAIDMGELFLKNEKSLSLLTALGELYFKRMDYSKSKEMFKRVVISNQKDLQAKDYLIKIESIESNFKRSPASATDIQK